MNDCFLCQQNWDKPPWADLWWSWVEDPEKAKDKAAELQVDTKQLKKHMDNHRVLQPPRPGTWRARDYENLQLSDRQMSVLHLLRYGNPLSNKDIALLLLGGDSQSQQMQIARDLRKLLSHQLVYRLYLEHLPGPGPRPDQPPALYLLGKSSRAVLADQLRKKHHWFEDLGDFPSWKEPYQRWQKNKQAAEIFHSLSILQLAPRGLITEPSFRLQDPLLGKTKLQASSILRVLWNNSKWNLVILRDRPEQTKTVEDCLKIAALQRAQKTPEPLLGIVPVRSAEQGLEILKAGEEHTLPSNSLVLVAPLQEIQQGNPRWRSLHHNQSGLLEDFFNWIRKKEASSKKER